MKTALPHRNSDGKLPAHVWPGGYPLIYLTEDGGVLCPACANGANGSEASVEPDADPGWKLLAGEIHYEGPPEICDHCGAAVESAYGEVQP